MPRPQSPRRQYWAEGQSIRLCDASTGHTVRDVAFCHSAACAEEFVRVLNEHAELVAQRDAAPVS